MKAAPIASGLVRSQELWAQALELFPGGVNSPVRAFGAVGGTPIFFERGEGPYLFDVDGRPFSGSAWALVGREPIVPGGILRVFLQVRAG